MLVEDLSLPQTLRLFLPGVKKVWFFFLWKTIVSVFFLQGGVLLLLRFLRIQLHPGGAVGSGGGGGGGGPDPAPNQGLTTTKNEVQDTKSRLYQKNKISSSVQFARNEILKGGGFLIHYKGT